MKKALYKIAVADIHIRCPKCSQTVLSPNGDNYWSRDEVARKGMSGKTECGRCAAEFEMPIRLLNLLAGD
jgi:hypothetical protein